MIRGRVLSGDIKVVCRKLITIFNGHVHRLEAAQVDLA